MSFKINILIALLLLFIDSSCLSTDLTSDTLTISTSPDPIQSGFPTTPTLVTVSGQGNIIFSGPILFNMNKASGVAGSDPGWTFFSLSAGGQAELNGVTIALESLTASNTPGQIPDFNPSASYSWNLITVSTTNLSVLNGPIGVDLSSFSNAYYGVFSASSTPSGLYLLYTPSPPLNIAPTGTNIVLSWPEAASNCVLECAYDSITNWIIMTNSATLVGNQLVVTNHFSGTNTFFRLEQ